jgi:sugar lactone lactonase YvrE
MIPDPFPDHDGGLWQPVRGKTVASWPAGHFAENLAVSGVGDVYVSLHSHNRIECYRPAPDVLTTFTTLPAPVAGLAFDRFGTLWATGGHVGQSPGHVWHIRPDGSFENWVEIEDALFLNGCTPQIDGRSLLVCESITGRILRVDMQERAWHPWIIDERLRPASPDLPGANGIKLLDKHAFISVTDSNRVFRAAIETDGSAGKLSLHAEHLRADDFAFSASGSLFIATHTVQTVMRLAANGERTTIAGPGEGAVGSTACAFGRTNKDANALYATTCGGIYLPYQGVPQAAKLLRLEVDEPGTPLLPLE